MTLPAAPSGSIPRPSFASSNQFSTASVAFVPVAKSTARVGTVTRPSKMLDRPEATPSPASVKKPSYVSGLPELFCFPLATISSASSCPISSAKEYDLPSNLAFFYSTLVYSL